MGTLIDLPHEQAEALERLSSDERQACFALIQAAVADYLSEKQRLAAEPKTRHAGLEAAFGIWKDRGIDGLAYQREMRAEWDRDWSE